MGLRWHNRSCVEATLGPLLPLFERERRAGRTLALGILVHTQGSTYRKPGALILMAGNGDYAGLISGGCLEGDLREHALGVIGSGQPRTVRYDLQGPDELLWGLGLGCEGAMRILILPVGAANDWQPLGCLAEALAAHVPAVIGVVCDSSQPGVPVGSLALPQDAHGRTAAALRTDAMREALQEALAAGESRWLHAENGSFTVFAVPLALPPRVLILGAGPDAAPVVDFAARLNWRVTVLDHRAAYANAAHFPAAEEVRHARPDELGALTLGRFSAAVLMSHHLATDLTYLRALAASAVPYVGLLGPAARRDKLLARLGGEARALSGRLHAPIGLPLGGRTPEAVALAIVAEIQAFLADRLPQARSLVAQRLRVASAD
jgi:xanthine/CO dehydrogenase XdhC/CoxF family maturation factor